MPFPLYVQAIEEIAKADASTAWCVAQTSVCSTISASLKHEVAWEIFGKDPRAVLAWGPGGSPAKAVPAAGGYRITRHVGLRERDPACQLARSALSRARARRHAAHGRAGAAGPAHVRDAEV